MLAFLITLALRKRSKIMIATCWRAVFASLILIALGAVLPQVHLPILSSASVEAFPPTAIQGAIENINHATDAQLASAMQTSALDPTLGTDFTAKSPSNATSSVSSIRVPHWTTLLVLLWAFGSGLVLLPLAGRKPPLIPIAARGAAG